MGIVGDALDALKNGNASNGLFWACIGVFVWILCVIIVCARCFVWFLYKRQDDEYDSVSESKVLHPPAWMGSQGSSCPAGGPELRSASSTKPRRKRGALEVEHAEAPGGSPSNLYDRRTVGAAADSADPANLYVTHSNPYAMQKYKEPQHRSLSSAALRSEPQVSSLRHMSQTCPPSYGHAQSPHASTTDPPASYHSLNARTLGSTWERTITSQSAGSPLSRERIHNGSTGPQDHPVHRPGDTIMRISPSGPRSGLSGPSGPRSGRSGTRSGPSGSPADLSPHAEPQTPPDRGHRRRSSTKGLHLQPPLPVAARTQPLSPDRAPALPPAPSSTPAPAVLRDDALQPVTRSSSSDEASVPRSAQPREAINPAAYNGMHYRGAGASNAFSQSQGFHLEAELMLIGAQESAMSSSTDTRTTPLEPSASIRQESVQLPQNPNISQYVGLVRQRHVYPQFVDKEAASRSTLAVWDVGVRLWKLRRRDKAQFAVMRRLHHLPTSTEGRFWKQAIDLDMSQGVTAHPALDQVRTVMGAEEVLFIELATHCWVQLSVLLPAMPPPAATSERWVPLKLHEGSVVSLPHGCMYKLSMTQRGSVGLVRVRMTQK